MNNIKKMDEFLNENMIPKKPYKTVKCNECGEEVCDKLDYKIGHLYNKHNCKPSVNDYKAKRMLVQYFPPVLKESVAPNAGTHGSVCIIIDDDDVDMFKTQKDLIKLSDEDKVSIDGNELWYYEHDKPTVKVLKKYFDLTRIWD